MKAVHITFKGRPPGNLFNLGRADFLEAAGKYGGETSYHMRFRRIFERIAHDRAVKLLGGKVKVLHPLYFMVNPPEAFYSLEMFKGGTVHSLDPALFDSSTFMRGDSGMYEKFHTNVVDNDEIEEAVEDNLELFRFEDAPAGAVLEGHVWCEFQVLDGLITEA